MARTDSVKTRPTHQVVLFAVDAAVDVVEGFATQGSSTGTAHEAARVVKVAHGLTGLSCSGDLLTARVAYACPVARLKAISIKRLLKGKTLKS